MGLVELIGNTYHQLFCYWLLNWGF
jgi:hypothetical protein